MATTITKYIGVGFNKGELYAALAYDTTDAFGGVKIKGISFSPVAGKPAINIGDSTTAWTALYTDKAISIYSTCASTNTSTNFEPVYINTVMTGAGQVGGRVRVNMETNVTLGGWVNAFKASVDWKTTGKVTGLGSAICAEMTMQGGATGSGGTYGVIEIELVCPASWSGSVPVSFIYAAVSGATKANFDDNGYLLNLIGVTSGSAHLWYDKGSAITTGDASEWLRVKTPGGTRYLMLYDSPS